MVTKKQIEQRRKYIQSRINHLDKIMIWMNKKYNVTMWMLIILTAIVGIWTRDSFIWWVNGFQFGMWLSHWLYRRFM